MAAVDVRWELPVTQPLSELVVGAAFVHGGLRHIKISDGYCVVVGPWNLVTIAGTQLVTPVDIYIDEV